MNLEFKDEMLIPKINGEIYFAIYELENWVRRICLTVYMKTFGDTWLDEIPKQMLNVIKKSALYKSDLSYIGADDDSNPIWSLTQGQLVLLLKNEKIINNLEDLIEFKYELFLQKIDELRQIRNFLAHNRALSKSTEIIANGIIESVRLAVKNFKKKIIYGDFDNHIVNCKGDQGFDEICEYFLKKMDKNDWSKFQAFIEVNDYFYQLVCLPVERDGEYPSAYKLLEIYNKGLDAIISFLINKTGLEYIILIPKKVSKEKMQYVIDKFISNPDAWTDKPFEMQNPKYICNPKVWFYENREPIEE